MKQFSLILQSLILCLLFLFTTTTADGEEAEAAARAATHAAELAATIAADAASQGVIELTTLKLDENIRDGSIWFIEFYAPWCHHCNAFAPAYARVAAKMHGLQLSETVDSAYTTKRPIKVAKINADQERACCSRFNVKGFPSFYLLDGWTAYQYEGKRNEEQIIAYIRGGYKSEDVSVCVRLCSTYSCLLLDWIFWLVTISILTTLLVSCAPVCTVLYISPWSTFCFPVARSAPPNLVEPHGSAGSIAILGILRG
jgi:thiol-disulfide isomerase/thioredoxin